MYYFTNRVNVYNIFIPNNFSQSSDEMYNLYKFFHISFRSDLFDCGAMYLIVNIFETPLTYEQITNFWKNYFQPISNMNLSNSEGKNFIRISLLIQTWVWFTIYVPRNIFYPKRGKNELLSNELANV